MPAVSPHVARWAISPFDIAERLLSEPGFSAMSHNGAAWRQTDIRPAALV
jgi:hypothetical protein